MAGSNGAVKHGYAASRKKRPLRLVLLTGAAALALLATPALAGSPADNKPQPEMYAFTVSSAFGGAGSGQVLPDQTLVVASTGNRGNRINVCVMNPGDRSCASTLALYPYSKGGNQDSFSGTPEVISTGGKNVSIVAEDCCYLPPFNGGAVIFNSTDDGKSFGKRVVAGNISSIGAATYAGGKIVVGSYSSSALTLQAFPPNPSSPISTVTHPNSREDGATSLSTYQGGVLVASDDTNGNTVVEYAKSGSNFNSSSSYAGITTIKGEDLTTISGNALMTDPGGSLSGGERLRFFDGHSFATWHKVPEPKNGDDGYFTLEKTGNYVHVFFINRRNFYDMYSESTTNGSTWLPLNVYNPIVQSTQLVPVLDSIGSGICFEVGGSPLRAQPIMLPQNVSLSLSARNVKQGSTLKLKGSDSVHLKSHGVTLQQLVGKNWKTFATTTETASGTFAFTVHGYVHTYRAVVHDDPGYFQYGYSNEVTVSIKK